MFLWPDLPLIVVSPRNMTFNGGDEAQVLGSFKETRKWQQNP